MTKDNDNKSINEFRKELIEKREICLLKCLIYYKDSMKKNFQKGRNL